jgi:hypothetical protein
MNSVLVEFEDGYPAVTSQMSRGGIMILKMGEIGDLITALDCAIGCVEMVMCSELPPGGPRSRYWKASDREQYRLWTNDLKVFRRLRRKRSRVEDAAAPRGAQGHAPLRARSAPSPLLISIDKPSVKC